LRRVTTDNQKHLKVWLESGFNAYLPENTLCIGQLKDDELVAVVGFCNFLPKSCEMHVASKENSNWVNKDFLWASFDYPFNQLNLNVIIASVEKSNENALRLNQHLGFKVKAEIPDGHLHGDLVIMTMRKEDCKWLNIQCPLRRTKEN
jgi:RimJ/RimL family protein N-acetyltransferase